MKLLNRLVWFWHEGVIIEDARTSPVGYRVLKKAFLALGQSAWGSVGARTAGLANPRRVPSAPPAAKAAYESVADCPDSCNQSGEYIQEGR